MDLFSSTTAPTERAASSDPLAGLNEAQRAAVTHEKGPLLILAGPGSGKTRVITQRIAWLVNERGLHPSEILAITFTNKAAREMRERVERLLPTRGTWISTFHAMCARILRREIEVLGPWTRDFTILDTSDRNGLIKRLLKEHNFDQARFKPAQVGAWLSERKHARWDAGDLSGALRLEPGNFDVGVDDSQGGIEEQVLALVGRGYQEALRRTNSVDFDDLLLLVLDLFERHPGIRDAYSSRFRQVMVDEYQDTNRVQYLLVRHLARAHGNLAVCGDPDQSIYGWRGADVRNILDFERDFPGPKVVKLEQNYRSTNTVLKAAQAVIEHNKERKSKDLWSELGDGEPVAVVECGDEEDEAAAIMDRIRGLEAAGTSLADVAIFYRVNFMQRALERALRLSGTPYHVVQGVEFFTRREIRDIVAFLKLIVNPADDNSFLRVVNVPARGIGEKSLVTLARWAADRRMTLLEACRSEEALSNIRGRAKTSLAGFAVWMDELLPLREAPAAIAVSGLLEQIDMGAWLGEMDDDGPDREANIDEFRVYAQEFDDLRDRQPPEDETTKGLRGFLEEISLVSDTDAFEEGVDKVTLMTLHAAKGLEFGVVFVAGVEEELLPHARALAEEGGVRDAIEEERRLLYVGMTRAKRRLFLTWASRRSWFGQTGFRRPSRFLEEIPAELVDGYEAELADPLGDYEAPSAGDSFRVGETVLHAHFGRGTIERLQGSGINARATVHFPRHGTKTLLLQYAKLQTVEAGR